MKEKDELFELIKTMDKQEKRYFKLYASRNSLKGNNNYLKLFDAMDGSKQYDEKKTIGKFSDHTFSHHFASTKYQLYKLILKSLTAYQVSENSDTILKSMLQHVGILHRKGLFDQCNRLLKKIIKTAEKNERYLALIDAFTWQYNLLTNTKDATLVKKELGPLMDKIKKTLREIELQFEYRKLQTRSITLGWTDKTMRSKESQEELLEIEKEISLKKLPESVNGHLFLNNTITIIADAKNDFKTALEARERCVEILEKNAELVADEPVKYLTALYNLIVYLHNTGQHTETIAYTDKLMKAALPGINKVMQRRYYLLGMLIQLISLTKISEAKNSIEHIKEAEAALAKWHKDITPHDYIVAAYNFSLFWFSVGDFSTALKWINIVLNNSGSEKANPVTFFYAKIFNLVIHFELGDMDYMERLVRSTYRFLLKRKRVYQFEETLLGFIRKKLPKVNSRKELLIAFSELKDEMELLSKDPKEAIMFENFNFVKWLEGKGR